MPHSTIWELMEESSTYQAILLRGRIAGARRLLLKIGEAKFGPPDAVCMVALENSDMERIEELGRRLLNANSWHELWENRPPRRRRGQSNARRQID